MSHDDHLLPPGTRLNDLYEIVEHIADGGIGIVYRARDLESGDPVAVKVLLARFARDSMILDLFKREAKILRKLKHDALTQYFVFTKEPSIGVYYLAMEFVGGPSLSKRLDAGPLEPEAVYTLLKRVASALQAVHESEVIHRDLSPDNIILQNGDVSQAKIIDFGISRANTGGPTIIGDGFAGKINYVSPEQVGIFGGNVTPRSDIYSLGLVLVEALTGKQIDMGGTQVQIVEKRRLVPPLEGIDARFRPLLEAMLQPDPADRPASMAEIADWTLGAPMRGAPPDRTIIRPTGLSPEQSALDTPPAKANWGRRILVALSLLGFAGVGAAGVYVLAGWTLPDQDRRPVLVAQPNPTAPTAPTVPAPEKPETESSPQQPETPVNSRPSQTAALDTATDQVGSGPTDSSPIDKLFVPELPDEVDDIADQPPEEPANDVTPEDRIRKFVGSYQGGDCMYLQPVEVAANSAAIEGFASRTPPFITFDRAFADSQGFEAKIQVNIVTEAQCPAISFLRATPSGSGQTELVLDLQRTVVPSGGNLAGRISGYHPGRGELALVFVASDGEVKDLTPYLVQDTGGAGFALPMTLQKGSEELGLVIAMVGPDVATKLGSENVTAAKAFFGDLVQKVSVLRAAATTVKVVP